MKYSNVVSGQFLSRPNRFIAYCVINGKEEICHVINTGRMKELLIPGTTVYLSQCDNPNRKTKYDLIGVEHNEGIVNIDSFAPNKIAGEYIPFLFKNVSFIRPETTFGNSRFDFYIETTNEKIFLEVKGVTLNRNGNARFPDAPTLRGTKHLYELIEAKKKGYRSCILFVIAMKGVTSFSPNKETDPDFANALFSARENGVEIFAVDCKTTKDSIIYDNPIPILFD